MLDLKKISLEHIGSLTVLGLVLVLITFVIMHFISPLLVTAGVLGTNLTFTDTILLLILIKHLYK